MTLQCDFAEGKAQEEELCMKIVHETAGYLNALGYDDEKSVVPEECCGEFMPHSDEDYDERDLWEYERSQSQVV